MIAKLGTLYRSCGPVSELRFKAPVNRRLSPLFLLTFLVFGGLVFCQTAGKTQLSYRLAAIEVKGLSHLHHDQIITASGLKVGEFQKQSDFEEALDRLGKTGLFTHLSYTYQCAEMGCRLQFEVTENEQLVPVLFDNLVWFSDGELLAMLKSRVSLFSGQLPLAGNLADQVSQALNDIVHEEKITGEISYRHASIEDRLVDSYIYRLEHHPVLIRSVDFPGAAPGEVEALQTAAKPFLGHEYLRSQTASQALSKLLTVYLNRGYLKAKFGDASPTVVEEGAQTWINLRFPVTPGTAYRLSSLEWSGNAVFPASKLQELVRLKIGEPVNAGELEADLADVEKLYGTKGYLFARVYPSSTVEDAQQSVSYQLNVSEGDLYRMGDLLLDGLDSDATKKIVAQWQIKKGAPYDNSYLGKFFRLIYRDVGLRLPYDVVPKQSIDSRNKTVSVALHFVPKS